jgi:hypothetical protein
MVGAARTDDGSVFRAVVGFREDNSREVLLTRAKQIGALLIRPSDQALGIPELNAQGTVG